MIFESTSLLTKPHCGKIIIKVYYFIRLRIRIFKPVAVTCPTHDGVIKWKHFPRYWPFVRGIYRVTGEFPAQRPVTRSFDVFFDLRLNKRLSKQSWGWWLETPSRPLWRHCNEIGHQDGCRVTSLIILHLWCSLVRGIPLQQFQCWLEWC